MSEWLSNSLPWLTAPFTALIVIAVGVWIANRTFMAGSGQRIYRQLAYLAIGISAIFLFLAMAPLEDKGTVLNIFGVALTAIIGLSSTTFVSNAMAGMMLKAMGSFHIGDFIQVGDYFGRVKSKALLHTEIQSEERDIFHLPNLFLITQPVKVVDHEGTLISAEVSLGYDVHRVQVRDLLLEAAQQAKLKESFVHILELGDFSIVYRVTGMLAEEGRLISKRHELRAAILDTLHAAGIEIMSPNVMSQRPLPADLQLIPDNSLNARIGFDSGKAERIMFDKSEMAVRIDRLRGRLTRLQEEVAALKESEQENKSAQIEWREQQMEDLKEIIANFDTQDD